MAHVAVSQTQSGLLTRISEFFSSMAVSLQVANESQARLDQIQRLQSKTDDELAAIGLTRDDIVRHVYRDMFNV